MRANRLKAIWAAGGTVHNAWLWIPSGFSAEIAARAGFDSVTVDCQHGLAGREAAAAMFTAISTTDAVPLARCQANDPGEIMRLLDLGAYGIVCPLVNSAEECRRFVAACRYPPAGARSFGPARGWLYGGEDYAERANDEIVTFAMIETREALAALDDILAVPGLDGVYVGPNDLCLSLGHPASQDSAAPEVAEAIERVRARAVAHGRIPGIACPSGAVAAKRVAQGFRFVTPGNEARLLGAALRAALAEARTGTTPPTEGGRT
jgi:4-hydroxy-2-oxoheptanedioate aldolase